MFYVDFNEINFILGDAQQVRVNAVVQNERQVMNNYKICCSKVHGKLRVVARKKAL